MSSYKTFSIQSKTELCEWILRKLGSPLITVELTEDQLLDAIDESVEEFTKYVNQERKWLPLDLSTYDEVSGFILPDCCTGVFSLNSTGGANGGFGGFNGGLGGFVGGNQANSIGFDNFGGSGGANSEAWITYEAGAQYIDMIKRMTASEYRFEYNNRTKSLTLIPNPALKSISGSKGNIVIGCNTIRPEQQQCGESWVKRYALALSKVTLGIIRSKFQNIQLLGGGSLDVSIKEEGIQERDALKEELKDTEGAFFTFYVGG